jgi:hypothetical protein
VDGKYNDSPRSKIADRGIDRLDANGQSESRVKINRCNFPRKIRERNNVPI